MPARPNTTKDPGRLSAAQFYSLSMTSGLLTTVAAGTSSAGHVAALRYVHASKSFHVTRLRALWQTITGFTAAQEVSLAAYLLSAYTAAHTGGSAGVVVPRASGLDATGLTGRIGDTGALTAGTQTIGAQLLRGSFSELADGVTVQKGFVDEQRGGEDDPHVVCVLGTETGILVRNEILMGAAGTGRLTVELDGYER